MTWPIVWFPQADASLPGSVAALRYLTQLNADFPVPAASYRMASALPPNGSACLGCCVIPGVIPQP
jgi:hypothetical protein